MKVVFLSRMPVAGAPWETMKCLNKYSSGDLQVRWISEHARYADGRVFPSDMIYSKETKQQCLQMIAEADIVHIQCDHPLEDDSVLFGKRLIIQFHSVPKRGTYEMYRKYGGTYYTTRQPWFEKEYPDLPSLPNLMDVEEYKPLTNKNNAKLNVVFAPSNDWGVGHVGSRAKFAVEDILRKFANQIETQCYSGVSYLRNLEIKQRSDILIDDVVNDTFHKTTLEGCCFGLAVITSWKSYGWLYSNLTSLPDTLRSLIENRELLETSKLKSREWILNEWHPCNLVKDYLDVYSKLLGGKLKSTLCVATEI